MQVKIALICECAADVHSAVHKRNGRDAHG